jgi:hypothetical protein
LSFPSILPFLPNLACLLRVGNVFLTEMSVTGSMSLVEKERTLPVPRRCGDDRSHSIVGRSPQRQFAFCSLKPHTSSNKSRTQYWHCFLQKSNSSSPNNRYDTILILVFIASHPPAGIKSLKMSFIAIYTTCHCQYDHETLWTMLKQYTSPYAEHCTAGKLMVITIQLPKGGVSSSMFSKSSLGPKPQTPKPLRSSFDKEMRLAFGPYRSIPKRQFQINGNTASYCPCCHVVEWRGPTTSNSGTDFHQNNAVTAVASNRGSPLL